MTPLATELVARGFTRFIPELFDQQCALMRAHVDFTDLATLEIGARDGRHSEAALAMGASQATALELRPGASRRIERTRPVQFVYGDCRLIHLPGTYDVVMAYGIVYHVPDPAALIRRLLGWSHGWVFLSTHCGDHDRDAAGGYRGEFRQEGTDDIDAANPVPSLWLERSELRRAITDAGGQIVQELDYMVGAVPGVWIAVRHE